MTDETGGESEQPDMDQQIIEAECRLEPLRVELIRAFEDNIKVEYRCKTCNLLWHEHKSNQVAGCGVKKEDVQPDVMLKSLMGEESRLDAMLQVREKITGTKAAVRELTRDVEDLGTKIDNGASNIVQLENQLAVLKKSSGISENEKKQLEKDKKDLQDKKKELEKQKQELEQRET